MSYFSLAQTQTLRGHRPTYSTSIALGPVSLAVLAIGMGFVLSLFYLSQTNRIATRGYEITTLQREKSDLKDQQARLEIQAARLQSIQSIKDRVSKSGEMVPVTTTTYLGQGR